MTRQQRASLTLSLLAVRPCGGDRTAGAGLAWVSPAAPRIFAWPVWWWDDRRLRHIYIHFALCVSPVSHPQAQVNGFLWRLLYARWPFMRARVCSGLSATIECRDKSSLPFDPSSLSQAPRHNVQQSPITCIQRPDVLLPLSAHVRLHIRRSI